MAPEAVAAGLAEPSEPVLVFDEVSVSFGGVKALEGVTAALNAGEVVALVGPNGAGKTTLLNAVCGLTKSKVGGSINFRGRAVQDMPAPAIQHLGVSRSFQHPPLIDELSVLENVLTGRHTQLRYKAWEQLLRRRRVRAVEREAKVEAEEALQLAGCSAPLDSPVSELSYGTRKLIDVARALVSRPALLLLDEPTSGLDSAERSQVKTVLAELRGRRDTTVVVVEHHMDLVRSACDRIIGMEAGRVLAIGTPGEVLNSEAFRESALRGGSSRTGISS